MAILLLGITALGCKKEQSCRDSSATNFKSTAEKDDGSCTYKGSVTFLESHYKFIGNVDVYVGGVSQVTITIEKN